MRPFVSLTIPCYNEGSFIFKAVEELTRVMEESPYRFEIILFDDKSLDETAKNIAEIARKNKRVRAFFHARNQGRGQTVKDAVMKSKGSIVGFIDIDLEIAAHYVPIMVKAVESGFDVVVADRINKINSRVLIRHVLSLGYQALIKRFLGIKANDTEAGCKFFNRKSILPVLRETRDMHWFWDTEVMALAEFRGLKIKEIPVVFTTNPETKSTVKIFSDIWKYLKAMHSFRKRAKGMGWL